MSFGLREDRDIQGAINYLRGRNETRYLPIGIWGYSFGGAVSIKVCTQSKEIGALVTDSTYASFPEMIIQYYGSWGPLKYIFGAVGECLGNILFKGKLSRLSPETFVEKVKVPILIIHAQGDPFVTVNHAEHLYEKAQEPKEKLILADMTHGPDKAGDYIERVRTFFAKYLLQEESTVPNNI